MDQYASLRDLLLTSLMAALPLGITGAAASPLNPEQSRRMRCNGKPCRLFRRAASTPARSLGKPQRRGSTTRLCAGIRDI